MQLTGAELAALVGGQLEGDASIVIAGMAGLREAGPEDVSFLDHPRYAPLLADTKAGVVLVAPEQEVPKGMTVIRVQKPSVAFGKIVAAVAPPPLRYQPGIDPQARISPEALVDPAATVQAFAVIEKGARVGARTVVGYGCFIGQDAVIGQDCLLYPNASIRERCIIGNRVILHCGAVVGSDGFGYDWVKDHFEKIPQVGIVQVDDDAEIGANTTIDRGRFGRTWIQKGVKLDNLVQIAHNVTVGQHSAIAAQAGISGSTAIGQCVRVAGQVGTVGHITIGDGAILGAQSGINHDVPPGKFMFGYPAQEHREAMKTHANIRRLPHVVERVRELEKRIEELEKRREG